MENCKSKMGLWGCNWSSLNAPGPCSLQKAQYPAPPMPESLRIELLECFCAIHEIVVLDNYNGDVGQWGWTSTCPTGPSLPPSRPSVHSPVTVSKYRSATDVRTQTTRPRPPVSLPLSNVSFYAAFTPLSSFLFPPKSQRPPPIPLDGFQKFKGTS